MNIYVGNLSYKMNDNDLEVVQFTLTGNTIHITNINNLTKEIEMPLWSKEEARLMAINNYRSKLI